MGRGEVVMAWQEFITTKNYKVGDTYKSSNGKLWIVVKIIAGDNLGKVIRVESVNKKKNPPQGKWIPATAVKFHKNGMVSVRRSNPHPANRQHEVVVKGRGFYSLNGAKAFVKKYPASEFIRQINKLGGSYWEVLILRK